MCECECVSVSECVCVCVCVCECPVLAGTGWCDLPDLLVMKEVAALM